MEHLEDKHKEVQNRSGNEVQLKIDFIGELQRSRNRKARPKSKQFLCKYENLKHNDHRFLLEIKVSQSRREYEQKTASIMFNTRILSAGEDTNDYRVFIKVFNALKVNSKNW